MLRNTFADWYGVTNVPIIGAGIVPRRNRRAAAASVDLPVPVVPQRYKAHESVFHQSIAASLTVDGKFPKSKRHKAGGIPFAYRQWARRGCGLAVGSIVADT